MKRLNLNTDTTLNSNSNTLASSQKAIKAYADTKLSKTDAENTYLPKTGGTLTGTLTLASFIGFTADRSGKSQIILPGSGQISGFDTGNIFIQNANNGLIFRKSDNQLVRRRDSVDSILLTEAEKAVANGVASLDANTKVPAEQIPFATDNAKGGVIIEFDQVNGIVNIRTE